MNFWQSSRCTWSSASKCMSVFLCLQWAHHPDSRSKSDLEPLAGAPHLSSAELIIVHQLSKQYIAAIIHFQRALMQSYTFAFSSINILLQRVKNLWNFSQIHTCFDNSVRIWLNFHIFWVMNLGGEWCYWHKFSLQKFFTHPRTEVWTALYMFRLAWVWLVGTLRFSCFFL